MIKIEVTQKFITKMASPSVANICDGVMTFLYNINHATSVTEYLEQHNASASNDKIFFKPLRNGISEIKLDILRFRIYVSTDNWNSNIITILHGGKKYNGKGKGRPQQTADIKTAATRLQDKTTKLVSLDSWKQYQDWKNQNGLS